MINSQPHQPVYTSGSFAIAMLNMHLEKLGNLLYRTPFIRSFELSVRHFKSLRTTYKIAEWNFNIQGKMVSYSRVPHLLFFRRKSFDIYVNLKICQEYCFMGRKSNYLIIHYKNWIPKLVNTCIVFLNLL